MKTNLNKKFYQTQKNSKNFNMIHFFFRGLSLPNVEISPDLLY